MDEPTILIVEDEMVIANDMKAALEKEGYRVADIVATGNAAIQKINKFHPDLILLDIKLKGKLNGIETAHIIKNNFSIPFIFVTSYSSERILQDAKITEPYGYLLKPFQNQELVSSIETALYKYQIEEKLRKSEKRFRNLTNLLPQPVFELDKSYSITFINKEFEELFHYSKEEAISNLNLLDIVNEEYKSKIKNKLDQVIEEEINIKDVEGTTTSRDGKIYSTLFYFSPILREYEIVGVRGIIIDISRQKEVENRLKEQKEYFQSLFNSSPFAIASIDRSRKVHNINPAFTQLFGYTKNEIVGKNLDSILSPKNYQEEAQNLSKRTFEGENIIEETTRMKKSGARIDVKLTTSPVIVSGETKSVIKIYQDLTKLQELSNKVIQKNKELEKVIYATSHDLRSPLLNIKGFAKEMSENVNEITDILKQTDIEQDKLEDIREIQKNDLEEAENYISSSIQKVESMINGLLKISRLGREELNIEKIDMNDLIIKIEKNFVYQIKQVSLNFQKGDLHSCWGDKQKINQVFSNLIGNAIKFHHPDRKPKIEITSEIKNENFITYNVKDNGIGIKEEQQDKIFEMFTQTENSSQEGDGLGLSLVKKIVEKHNGNITVSSTPNQGTTFKVELPRNKKGPLTNS